MAGAIGDDVASSVATTRLEDAGVDLSHRGPPRRGIRDRIRAPRVRAGRTAREYRDA